MVRPEALIAHAAAPASPSLLQLLRSRTTPAHRSLDASLDFSPGALSRERYAAFLLGTWMVVETLEPALDALLDGLGLPPLERSRRATLRADLAALGFTQTPTPSATPLPRSIAAAWGAAYVLEGSSLGGVILAKRVRDILGARVADEVTGYLRLRREGTKASWASFTAALAAFDARATPAERDESCASATETFDAYARAFAESGALVQSADVEAAS